MVGLLGSQAKLPDYNDPTSMQTESEMLMNVCWFNCMGVDDASGKFDLDNGSLRLRFDQEISEHPTFKKADAILRGMAQPVNGSFRPFPLWDCLAPFVPQKLSLTHPFQASP